MAVNDLEVYKNRFELSFPVHQSQLNGVGKPVVILPVPDRFNEPFHCKNFNGDYFISEIDCYELEGDNEKNLFSMVQMEQKTTHDFLLRKWKSVNI